MTSFFFAPESPRVMALIRVTLGLVLYCDAAFHWRYAIELYSTSGPPMPLFVRPVGDNQNEPAAAEHPPSRVLPRVEPLFAIPVPSPRVAVVAQTLLVVCFASVMLGWRTRTSLVLAVALALWLWPLDLAGTFAKHSVMALHLLLLLAFSRCGAVWSLDARLSAGRTNFCRLSNAAPRRLMQLLVCSIYLGAAITKLKTPAFANGDLLTFSLLDDHWGGARLGLWLTTLPCVPLLLSLGTILYEIVFPVLIWVPRCRLFVLGLALAVHTAMAGLLNLGTFSPIVLAALLSFLTERDLQALGRFIRNKASLPERRAQFAPPAADHHAITRPHVRASSAAVHGVVAASFVAAGYAGQYYFDWYGEFERRPLAPLSHVSADDFAEMLAQRLPAYEDYFHRIELGSRIGGNQVFGSPRYFKTGQRAYVLAQMIQPHPVIELEGLLVDPGGREVARFTRHVEPRFNYAINGFELTSALPAGTYRIILRIDEFVIAERRFELGLH